VDGVNIWLEVRWVGWGVSVGGGATGDGSGGWCVPYGGVVSYTLGMTVSGSSELIPLIQVTTHLMRQAKNTSMTSYN